MSRTPIPAHLIHNSTEVAHNANLFDKLCDQLESVAAPVARAALAGGKLPRPDAAEYRDQENEVTQVLTSGWLGTLQWELERASQSVLRLDPALLPQSPTKTAHNMGSGKLPMQNIFTQQSLVQWGVTEAEVKCILGEFRDTLFPVPGIVELPFGMAIVGAPSSVSVPNPPIGVVKFTPEVAKQAAQFDFAHGDAQTVEAFLSTISVAAAKPKIGPVPPPGLAP